MLTYILFIIGFVLLIKGADCLVDGAVSLGRRFHVSDLAIGLTVVAFGTSMPELFVNLIASYRGDTGIAIGNILGSNIANVFLILGVSAVIVPLQVGKGTVWKEIPLSLLAAVLLGIMANDTWIDGADQSVLTRTDGLVLLAFFIIFLYYTIGIAGSVQGLSGQIPPKTYRLRASVLLVAVGLAALGIGARWIVAGATAIAEQLGISQSVIGLTVVAVGTSLPELATSVVAAYKKNAEIAVGNVVGSNIFNIFFVLGISATIRPLPFESRANFDIAAVILSSALLFVWMFTGKEKSLDRWEAIVFIILYAAYIAMCIHRA